MIEGWAARVYAADKRTSILCQGMQRAGFRFDVERAREISEELARREASSLEAMCNAIGADVNPQSPNQLAWAFFTKLGAPVYFRSQLTGRACLDVNTMRAYAATNDPVLRTAALSLLEFRRAKKLRSTYVDKIHVGADGRVHPTWLNYGTISGRFSCQGPNLMNLPHPVRDPTIAMGGIRGLYRAADGHKLIYWDFGQLEMRVAAYASGDQRMIQACESGDLHSANAAALFTNRFDQAEFIRLSKLEKAAEKGGEALGIDAVKALKILTHYRQIAKQSGFAVCYGAGAPTVHARMAAEGLEVTLREVELVLRLLHRNFRGYYDWQAEQLNQTIRTGWVASPILGRRRIVGHAPDETMVMNFPIQGGAADVENSTLLQIVDRLAADGLWGRVQLIAQVHDSNVLECPDPLIDIVVGHVQDVCSQPIEFTTSGQSLKAVMPIDLKILERWK